MCGLGVQLVQGAHVNPVSAPGSHDEPWNGLALCPNHHLAFDRHLLAVDVDTRAIVFHPTVVNQASGNPAVQALIDGTFDRLAEPTGSSLRPKSEMLRKRYEHYADYYRMVASAVSSACRRSQRDPANGSGVVKRESATHH